MLVYNYATSTLIYCFFAANLKQIFQVRVLSVCLFVLVSTQNTQRCLTWVTPP